MRKMRVKFQVLVGIACGFLLVIAFGVASADEQSSTLATPEVELAPAVVVAAGADSIDVNAVARLTTYGDVVQRGTAFQLDDGRLATVAHALVDARRASLGDDGRAVPLDLQSEPGGRPPAVSRLHDLAVVSSSPLSSSMSVASSPASVGQQVALAGYPSDGRLRAITGSIISRTSGVDYGLGRPDVYVISAEVDKGWSGGPVVDGNGEVIAIIVGREQRSGVTIAVPVEHLPHL